jgi:hypothetical protein
MDEVDRVREPATSITPRTCSNRVCFGSGVNKIWKAELLATVEALKITSLDDVQLFKGKFDVSVDAIATHFVFHCFSY